jgi:hypothetical protein
LKRRLNSKDRPRIKKPSKIITERGSSKNKLLPPPLPRRQLRRREDVMKRRRPRRKFAMSKRPRLKRGGCELRSFRRQPMRRRSAKRRLSRRLEIKQGSRLLKKDCKSSQDGKPSNPKKELVKQRKRERSGRKRRWLSKKLGMSRNSKLRKNGFRLRTRQDGKQESETKQRTRELPKIKLAGRKNGRQRPRDRMQKMLRN